jgi:hypothetical protein
MMLDLVMKLLELELSVNGEVGLLLEYEPVVFWVVGSF